MRKHSYLTVGARVRLKPWHILRGNFYVVPSMEKYAGKIVTIANFEESSHVVFTIEEDARSHLYLTNDIDKIISSPCHVSTNDIQLAFSASVAASNDGCTRLEVKPS